MPPRFDGKEAGWQAGGDDIATEAVQRDAVHRALGALSHRQRAIVVLRYVEDLPVSATAELLGCSEVAVKVQAKRALTILRDNPHWRCSRRRRYHCET
jgi:RNA polymerase sigma factor (sigma-70 family)